MRQNSRVIEEHPIFVTVRDQALDLSTGARPTEGSIFQLTASDDGFPKGLRENELAAVDGVVESDLQAAHSRW